jgi:hypothetical protein
MLPRRPAALLDEGVDADCAAVLPGAWDECAATDDDWVTSGRISPTAVEIMVSEEGEEAEIPASDAFEDPSGDASGWPAANGAVAEALTVDLVADRDGDSAVEEEAAASKPSSEGVSMVDDRFAGVAALVAKATNSAVDANGERRILTTTCPCFSLVPIFLQ